MTINDETTSNSAPTTPAVGPFTGRYVVMNDKAHFEAAVSGARSRKHVLDNLALGYGAHASKILVQASRFHGVELPAARWTAANRRSRAQQRTSPAVPVTPRQVPVADRSAPERGTFADEVALVRKLAAVAATQGEILDGLGLSGDSKNRRNLKAICAENGIALPAKGRRAVGQSPIDDVEQVTAVIAKASSTSDAVRQLGLKECGSTNRRLVEAAGRYGLALPWLDKPADTRRGVAYLKSLPDDAIREALEACDWKSADALRHLEVPPAGGTYKHMALRRKTITPDTTDATELR